MNKEKEVISQSTKELIIRESFADKKGRLTNTINPFTCYVNINSPVPDLQLLTASLLETLMGNVPDAYVWALNWDKSIVSVSAGSRSFCSLIPTGDQRGKGFVPVSTVKSIDGSGLLRDFPDGKLGILAVNEQSKTTDAFLISYFHMVNELIWDMALRRTTASRPSKSDYVDALELVASEGFSPCVLSEDEIVSAKQKSTDVSIRIYGSQVNKFVPQILGAVIR